MYEIEYNLKHCNNEKFIDNIIIKVDSLKEMEEEFYLSILNAFDNAKNQISRGIYPEKNVDFKLEYISSNFLNSENSINDFKKKADKSIGDQIKNKKREIYFKKKILKINKEYLIESLNYAQYEKNKRKMEYKMAIWKREKEEFSESIKLKKNNKIKMI